MPRRSAANDSERHTVAHCQFENGRVNTQSRWTKTSPAMVTLSEAVSVKSTWHASPGRCACVNITLRSGPRWARHCRIRRAIIDKHVEIPPNTTIGYDLEKDRKHFHVTESGIVVIPKGMRIEGRS